MHIGDQEAQIEDATNQISIGEEEVEIDQEVGKNIGKGAEVIAEIESTIENLESMRGDQNRREKVRKVLKNMKKNREGKVNPQVKWFHLINLNDVIIKSYLITFEAKQHAVGFSMEGFLSKYSIRCIFRY